MVFGALAVSEQAAIAAAKLRGCGDKMQADAVAVAAMRETLSGLEMKGRIVIGEGERDKAPMLYIGEEVGNGAGEEIDIALDPLEGTDVCAGYQANALAVIAFSPRGGLLNAPDVYMQKLACGMPFLPDDILNLDYSTEKNISTLAEFCRTSPSSLCVSVLDRPRHETLIKEIRQTGARVKLIGDGDILAILATTDPKSGVHLYMGSGGAPEGVLSAAALQTTGGFIQGRLIIRDEDEGERAKKWGIKDMERIYNKDDMASKNVVFSATGVTDGTIVKGVAFGENSITTDSLLLHCNHSKRNAKKLRVTTEHPLP